MYLPTAQFTQHPLEDWLAEELHFPAAQGVHAVLADARVVYVPGGQGWQSVTALAPMAFQYDPETQSTQPVLE